MTAALFSLTVLHSTMCTAELFLPKQSSCILLRAVYCSTMCNSQGYVSPRGEVLQRKGRAEEEGSCGAPNDSTTSRWALYGAEASPQGTRLTVASRLMVPHGTRGRDGVITHAVRILGGEGSSQAP